MYFRRSRRCRQLVTLQLLVDRDSFLHADVSENLAERVLDDGVLRGVVQRTGLGSLSGLRRLTIAPVVWYINGFSPDERTIFEQNVACLQQVACAEMSSERVLMAMDDDEGIYPGSKVKSCVASQLEHARQLAALEDNGIATASNAVEDRCNESRSSNVRAAILELALDYLLAMGLLVLSLVVIDVISLMAAIGVRVSESTRFVSL